MEKMGTNLNVRRLVLDIGCGWGAFMGYATDCYGAIDPG